MSALIRLFAKGRKGVKCCGRWNQPCRCPSPCNRYHGGPCRCPNCDCS